jgi:hypothetical protein
MLTTIARAAGKASLVLVAFILTFYASTILWAATTQSLWR